MKFVRAVEELEAMYGTPVEASQVKVATRLTPLYREWIMASRFCILSTVGPDGTDASPRGDDGPVVKELDESTLALPDWRGNQRLDSLRNIVADGRVSLMFMVPGNTNVIRVNGTARVTDDNALRAQFERKKIMPRTVTIVAISEMYFQCARALVRSELWKNEQAARLPSVGDILAEMTSGKFDGQAYDKAWPKRAKETLW